MSKPEILYRAHASQDGFAFRPLFDFENPDIVEGEVKYEEFRVRRFTPTGCYVSTYAGLEKWVSLTHRKRFAYPTKKEALDNLVARRRKWLKILKAQIGKCEEELKVAERQQAREAAGSVGVEPNIGGPDETQTQNPAS